MVGECKVAYLVLEIQASQQVHLGGVVLPRFPVQVADDVEVN